MLDFLFGKHEEPVAPEVAATAQPETVAPVEPQIVPEHEVSQVQADYSEVDELRKQAVEAMGKPAPVVEVAPVAAPVVEPVAVAPVTAAPVEAPHVAEPVSAPVGIEQIHAVAPETNDAVAPATAAPEQPTAA